MLLAGLTRPHGAVRISSSPHPARTASSPPRQWPTGSKRFRQATSSTVGLSDREREKLYSAGTRWMQRVGRRSKSFHVAPFEGKKNAKKKKKEPKKSPEKLLLKESTKSQPFREAEWDEARFSLGSTAARPDRSHLSSPRLPRRQPPAGCCCCGSNQATSGPLRFAQGMLHHRPAKAH